MKIVVTGSEGFIGKQLCKELEPRHKVIRWDKKLGKDIRNFYLNGADYVIHLAGRANIPESIDNPQLYWQENVRNTTKIQRHCRRSLTPLIYASSSCIHQWYLSPYGMSKKVNEETAFENQYGLRFTTVYGNTDREEMFVSRILNGNLEYATSHIRDFVHVKDVVQAIIQIMYRSLSKDNEMCRTYDIGLGRGYKVSELAKLAGYDVPEVAGEEYEAEDNTADLTNITEIGWNPTIDIVDFIKNESGIK